MTSIYCTKRIWPGYNTAFPAHCKHKAIKDGLCKYHQPEAIARREAKRDAKVAALHARFRHNSAVHEARQRVVKEAMRIYRDIERAEWPDLFRACKKLSLLEQKGPTT